MKKAASILIIATLIPLLSVIYSCNRSKEKTLTIVDSIRIDKSSSLADISTSLIGSLVFSPLLYKYNSGTAIHYVLAEEVKILPGKKVIEVKIRDNIRFHDGKLLTAEDIVRSIDTLKTEFNRETLKDITAKAVDRLRLRLESKSPVADTNELLRTISAYPSHSNIFNGTGPFRLKKFQTNGIELEANDGYFEGKPKLKRIIYLCEADENKRLTMLLKGEADLLAGLSPEAARFLEKDIRFNVHKDDKGFYTALFFNNKSSIFSDQRVRMALSMAMDRKSIIEKGLNGGGTVISSPFPAELLPSDIETGSQYYNPKQAVKILKEAGWNDADGDGILEKDGRKLRSTLYYQKESEELKRIADIIAQQLFEIGVGMESAGIGENEIEDLSGDYDVILFAAAYGEYFHLNRWLSSSPVSRYGNLSCYGNTEVDGLLERLIEADTIVEKKMIYGRLKEILDKEVPAAFFYAPANYIAVSKGIRGVGKLGFDVFSFYKIKDWNTEGR